MSEYNPDRVLDTETEPDVESEAVAEARSRAIELARLYRGRRLQKIHWVAKTGSTNDDLTKIAKEGGCSQVLIADLQTSGRGRRNRTWVAPANSSLLMSLLLRDCELDGFWLVAAISLAAQQTCNELLSDAQHTCNELLSAAQSCEVGNQEISGTVTLKWPNDLLVGERKLAGVLTTIQDNAIIAGIGININRPKYTPEQLSDTACWVNDYLPKVEETQEPIEIDRVIVAAKILSKLDELLDSDVESLRQLWKQNCVTLNKNVRIEADSGDKVVGVAVDIAPDGALIIQSRNSRTVHHVGNVVHLRTI